MRRFLALLLIAFCLCAAPLQSAFARPTVAALVQPLLVEIDERLAPLAQATLKADRRLKSKLLAARAALVAAADSTDDLVALGRLKSFAGKLAKAAPRDPDFAALFATALDGFDGVVAELRADVAARIARRAVPSAFAKSLAKLDAAIAAARKPGLAPASRGVKLAAAISNARSIDKALSKCPGVKGAFGHGTFSALVDTVLFAPKFAAAELSVDAAGTPLVLHIDGYRYPYEDGTIGLTIAQSVVGVTTNVVYDHAAGNLFGDYNLGGTYSSMESGTLTLTEFDSVKRRIVGEFEFTARNGAGTPVVVSSGAFTICDFKVTVVP